MPQVVRSPMIKDRRDFGSFCNYHGLMEAVEVGVDRGDFAWHFMRTWRGRTLFLVDPYSPDEDRPYGRQGDLALAVAQLSVYCPRIKFVMAPSVEAVSILPAGLPVDFVYIDAMHDYESVKTDIATWWRRLSPGGILAGHDYHYEFPGLIRAVDEFADANQLAIYHTWPEADLTTPISWYVHKPTG